MSDLTLAIIVLVVGGILIFWAEKEQKKRDAKMKEDRNKTFESKGFIATDEDSVSLVDGRVLTKYFDKLNLFPSVYFSEPTVYKNGECKIAEVSYIEKGEQGYLEDGIDGFFLAKKIDFSIDKPLMLYHEEDIDGEVLYFIDYEKWKSDVPCSIDIEPKELDFEIEGIPELNGAYVSKEEASFKQKCANLINDTVFDFMFAFSGNELEILLIDVAKEDRKTEAEMLRNMDEIEELGYKIDYLTRLADDIEDFLKENMKLLI